MADQIGRVPVPAPVRSGATFTLKSEFGFGMTQDWTVVEHRFGGQATLAVQRYGVGSGARKFQFIKSVLNYHDRQYLLDFYNQVQGSYQSFTYPVPTTDLGEAPPGVTGIGTTFTNVEVVFDTPPLSLTELVNHTQTGMVFSEIVDPATAYTANITGSFIRFPNSALATALTSQVQILIPLIHIKVRNPAVPDIYLSDRRVIVNSFPGAPSPTTFLPRLLGVGVPGTSDVIMSQSLDGRADNVRFVFGNADRTMTKLVNDCSLEFAEIDMSFFHVGTGILLQLWKGVIISWQVDGSAQMSLNCSDGLYPITQSYPPRVVSRQCWKPFDKDILPGYRPCPWSTAGGGVGNAAKCDYFYNSANGCLSHNMSQYFGGHPEQPQTVVIKESGGPIFGAFVGSTSILSDSIWSKPLPEIWCNYLGTPQRAFWANCMVAAVRDEGSFMDLLGIVGAGPIGGFEGMSVQTNSDGYKFVVAPTADGFFPQGFKVDSNLTIKDFQPTYGLRQSLGNDPAHKGTSITDGIDAFSLGQGTPQHWEEHDATWSNVTGRPNTIIPYAAGTALCEMRYPKSSSGGVAPTTAESHNMQCPIRFGLTASVWDTSDVRTLVPGCVNPFWVAANTYLRALGLQQADAATQLSYLVRSSITNTSPLGCADVANQWVDPVVGTVIPSYTITPTGLALTNFNLDYYNGTFTYQNTSGIPVVMSLAAATSAGYIVVTSTPNKEPQFQFQGTLGEFKPFRDWMTEILNCCLGYYCFEFGKLRLGIRYSAVPTDSYNLDSTLYQSLTVAPIPATFEYLKINFANVELQYQQDLAEYEDKDHALYYGRAGSPLTSTMRSVGCSTLSQGLRIAVTRTREEVGGIYRDDLSNPYIEWDNHKRITFKTTLLGLGNEVGQVISLTHPDLPTYPGAHPGSRAGSNAPFAANTWPYRIQKWMLHSDWSVTIVADSCVDSMFDLLVGTQPQGVGPRPPSVMFFPEPLGQWAPHQIQGDPADALYANEFSFNLQQMYQYQADGTLYISAVLAGVLPVNTFVPNCGAPDVKKGSVTWATTGGSIPGGITLFVQVCAAIVDATPVVQQWSPPSEILVLQVPTGTNTNTLTINNIRWPTATGLNGWALFASTAQDLISGQQSGLGQPASITFTGPVARQTYSVPDFDVGILRLRATRLIHGGVLGAGVDSLTTTTITSTATVDFSAIDNWAGRVLAIIGRQQGSGIAPFSHFNITAFNAATGTYTLDRDPTAASTTGPVAVGDVFVVCMKGVDNSANPYVVSDSGLSNASNIPPHTGEATNDPNRIGQMVRVIKGLSRGLSAKIVANTATSYTLDRALPIDATSVWVVTDPGWAYSKDVVIDNADPSKTTLSAIEINNYSGIPLLVEGVTIDFEGDIVDDTNACVRMLYIPGVQGTTNVST